MPLAPELISIAERLIAAAMRGRDDSIGAVLDRREYEARRSDTLRMGCYAREQKDACIKEMEERVDIVWSIYRRIIIDASVPWTDDIRIDVLARVGRLIDQGVPGIEDAARRVISQHGHGFDLFLTESGKALRERISAEVDLFRIRYRPLSAAVALQMQADRYSGPRQHWIEAQAALLTSPVKFTQAAREAIHAVEGVAKIVAENSNATLGECVKALRKRGQLDSATANTLEALWGLANTIQGLRHGATAEQTDSQAQAEYIVGMSEAALRLLLSLDVPGNAST